MRRSTGLEQRVRLLIAGSVAFWLIGQLAWNLETVAGDLPFPGPADLPWLMTAAPAILALILVIRGRISRAEESAVYLDAAAIFLAITALILQAFGDQVAPAGLLVAAVAVAYPMVHIATAGAGLIALLAVRMEARLGGGYLVLASFALLGFAWVEWLRHAPVSFPAAGSLMNYGFSIAIIGIGIGGATWRMREATSVRFSPGCDRRPGDDAAPGIAGERLAHRDAPPRRPAHQPRRRDGRWP